MPRQILLRARGWWCYLAAPLRFGFICTGAALLSDGLGLMLNGDPQRYFPMAN